MQKLVTPGPYFLSPPQEQDIPAFVEHFREKEIYDNTLLIPFPYTQADGRWFVNFCRETENESGHALNFAIRNEEGFLIGGAGFHGRNTHPVSAHRDEIGYWLAKPYWNKGIMSQVIPALLDYGRSVRKISRFEAMIFAGNIASEKVLLKCGFKEEGFLKNVYLKDGKLIDAKLLALAE